MATQDPIVFPYSFEAGADLSGQQFHFVKMNNTGQVILATASGDAIGVLQNKPKLGGAATVCIIGVTKVVADANLLTNAEVGVSADGQAMTETGGPGRVLVAANTGGIATVFLNCLK
jgi:hypothetical protein